MTSAPLEASEQAALPASRFQSAGGHRSQPRSWIRATSFVGIDIGEQCVRVATLRRSNSSTIETDQCELDWVAKHQFEVPQMQGQELSPSWLESVLATIHEKLPRCIDGESNVAAIALPISWTHYQTVEGNEIANTRQRCNQMFAESVFQSPAHVCHWPVVGIHHGRPSIDDQYVIAATAETTACAVADLVSSLGYSVRSILPHGVALAHAAEDLTGIDAQCVLWLSHTASLIAVIHQTGVGLVRTLPSVPNRILQLDQPDRPLDAHTLRPYLTEIAAEFRSTARYAARADMSKVSKKPILIAGPIAEIPGVEGIIATLTKTPVGVWSFAGAKKPPRLSRHRQRDAESIRRLESSFAGALSLAVASIRSSKRGYGQ